MEGSFPQVEVPGTQGQEETVVKLLGILPTAGNLPVVRVAYTLIPKGGEQRNDAPREHHAKREYTEFSRC